MPSWLPLVVASLLLATVYGAPVPDVLAIPARLSDLFDRVDAHLTRQGELHVHSLFWNLRPGDYAFENANGQTVARSNGWAQGRSKQLRATLEKGPFVRVEEYRDLVALSTGPGQDVTIGIDGRHSPFNMASLKNFIDAEYPGMERGNMINLQERGQRIALAVLGAADKHLTELRDASLSSFVTKPKLPGAAADDPAATTDSGATTDPAATTDPVTTEGQAHKAGAAVDATSSPTNGLTDGAPSSLDTLPPSELQPVTSGRTLTVGSQGAGDRAGEASTGTEAAL